MPYVIFTGQTLFQSQLKYRCLSYTLYVDFTLFSFYRTEQDLTKHMKFHSGEMVSVYQCDTCQKTFSHHKNLAQHMKIHQGTAKQYKCPECPASYSYKCHLTRHLMIHTGKLNLDCYPLFTLKVNANGLLVLLI